jgi:hypothetical protein
LHISIEIADLYNLHDLTAAFPVNRLTAPRGAVRSWQDRPRAGQPGPRRTGTH